MGPMFPRVLLFQSTCPARGTTRRRRQGVQHQSISIHVPREGHDRHPGAVGQVEPQISIHVPREGHDPLRQPEPFLLGISIHVPREGHDSSAAAQPRSRRNFNPRAPRGARLLVAQCILNAAEFQSTCPARGTTANMHNFFVQICARVTNIPLKGMPYLQKTYVSI